MGRIFYSVFILLFLLTSSVEGRWFMERFEWLPSESAHKQYPMKLITGVLLLEDGSTLYVPSKNVIDNGWGELGSTHIVGEKLKSLPIKLHATWFSFAEDKFFTGEFQLPLNKIQDLFRKGTFRNGKKITYDRIIFGFGPEGAVSVWVEAEGEVVEVAAFKGREAALDWTLVLNNEKMTRKEYISATLNDSLTKDQMYELRSYGVPSGISDTFRFRYPWTLSVAGSKDVHIWVKTANGEKEYFGAVTTEASPKYRAVPKSLELIWKDAVGRKFVADIVLNENEVVAACRKLTNGQKDRCLHFQIEINDMIGVINIYVRDQSFVVKLKKCAVEAYRF